MLFANWDAGCLPLAQYLGDLRWYMDIFLTYADMGGMEVLTPVIQKWEIRANWKMFSDNSSGDHYHAPTTHQAAHSLSGRTSEFVERPQDPNGRFSIYLGNGHALGGVMTDTARWDQELARAQRLGGETLEWARASHAAWERRVASSEAKPSMYVNGLLFPNLFLTIAGSGQAAMVMGHPKTVDTTELWIYYLVEKDAPDRFKRLARKARSGSGQSGAGMVGVDDSENYDRMMQMASSPMGRQLNAVFNMQLPYDGHWHDQESWNTQGMPGMIGPQFWETAQRGLYREWAKRMELE
jgi:phenylpropionate dioxygenase-like ring-hydroxylating dioxygenase large terminal subunit